MIWLSWRQHRTQLAVGAGTLAAVWLILLVTEHSMTSYLHSSGLSGCLASHASCDVLAQQFNQHFGSLLNTTDYLNFVPLLIGLFWGAPLVARELEQGTELLAWTQSVSRARWLNTKLVVFLLAASAVGVAFSLLFSWWSHPFAAVGNDFARITPHVFDFVGIAPLGYSLFALALGIAAGVLTRRTIPAMVITIAGFATARFGVRALRAHLIPPLRVVLPIRGPDLHAHADWIVNSYFVDRTGHNLGTTLNLVGCRGLAIGQCLAKNDIKRVDLYEPANRFWSLQTIEFAIFTGLAMVLLAVVAWWVTRRT